jgi:hypothetical protein
MLEKGAVVSKVLMKMGPLCLVKHVDPGKYEYVVLEWIWRNRYGEWYSKGIVVKERLGRKA